MKPVATLLLLAAVLATPAPAASAQPALQQALERLTRGFDGRVGVCIQDASGAVSLHGDQRFPLQSVMKLPVALAVMDAVDHRGWRLDAPITVRKQDLSLFHQPIAEHVTAAGYRTTIGDLMRRAVTESDNAAADLLIARLGGASVVQACLDRHGLRGIRIDRDERRLQTEIFGLRWQPSYVEAAVLDRAIAAVPASRREAAFRRYLADPRDTATPRGFALLLDRLAKGQLLSPASTRTLIEVMEACATGADRLKAGLAPGWTLGHKTGTSNTWQGITAATNDAGIMRGPDGRQLSIVVFIAESRASAKDRAALMANVARAAIAHQP